MDEEASVFELESKADSLHESKRRISTAIPMKPASFITIPPASIPKPNPPVTPRMTRTSSFTAFTDRIRSSNLGGRKASMYYIDKTESRNPALVLMWKGELEQAESQFAGKKEADPLACVRWAECQCLRFWFTGDSTMVSSVFQRLEEAEMTCLTTSRVPAEKLRSACTREDEKQPIFSRTGRRLSRVMRSPLGWIPMETLGRLVPAQLETEEERTALDDWKRLQGLAAFCVLWTGVTCMIQQQYIKAAFHIRRAWRICRQAMGQQLDCLEAGDTPNALGLVSGTFQIVLSYMPPWMLTFLRAVGFAADAATGRARLERLMELTDPSGENHNYARLVLAADAIVTSTYTFRLDRQEQLERARELLNATLEKHPDWILFRWMRSHVLRRMGRVDDATQIIRALTVHIQSQIRTTSYRLTYDLAWLMYIQGHWTECETLLLSLVDEAMDMERRHCTWYGSVLAMLSVCNAMRGNIIASTQWLEKLGQQDRNGSELWRRKADTLAHRPHKRLLMYEMAYLEGYSDWWKSHTRIAHELKEIYDEAEISIVYPGQLISVKEANEEYVTATLLSGHLASISGRSEDAIRYFTRILENVSNASIQNGIRADPWHVAFTRYELGVLHIQKESFHTARDHLIQALKLCRRKNFTFHQTLALKVTGALRSITSPPQPRIPSSLKTKSSSDSSDTHVRFQDEIVQWMEKDTNPSECASLIVTTSTSSAPIPLDGRVEILEGETMEVNRDVLPGETVTWSWVLEQNDVRFTVYLDPEGGVCTVVQPNKLYDAGDTVEGCFTTKQVGTMRFCWDNTHCLTEKKVIHYQVTGEEGSDVVEVVEEDIL
jgi:tetratricopeptide (TPR) repeat protein